MPLPDTLVMSPGFAAAGNHTDMSGRCEPEAMSRLVVSVAAEGCEWEVVLTWLRAVLMTAARVTHYLHL